MANYIPKKLGKANDFILGLTQDSASVMTGPVNKLWRSFILLHRATHNPHQQISKVDPAKGDNTLVKEESRGIKSEKANSQVVKVDLSPHESYINNLKEKVGKVIIYNLSKSPYSKVVLQNIPNEIGFRGETTWATIKSMGRNTPMYHYTGSEDTVQFNISWYCNDRENLDEVVTKCRLLESWSKSNNYISAPPVLSIEWGSSSIFENHKYILISATYTLNNFNQASRLNNREVQSGKLLPSVATQELVFKRVSENSLSYEDMVNSSKVEKIKW